jgi:hypothetical protein
MASLDVPSLLCFQAVTAAENVQVIMQTGGRYDTAQPGGWTRRSEGTGGYGNVPEGYEFREQSGFDRPK